jgi:hypothetical protein
LIVGIYSHVDSLPKVFEGSQIPDFLIVFQGEYHSNLRSAATRHLQQHTLA